MACHKNPAWTEASAAAKSRRKMASVQAAADRHLIGIAALWGDVDNGVVWECDEARRAIAERLEGIGEAIDERLAISREEAA